LDKKIGEVMISVGSVTLSKWGNSSAIRIPNQVIKQLNLYEGVEMEIMVTSDDHILLRPVLKKQDNDEDLREHLEKLLMQITPESPRHEEVDFGMVGEEKI
jgi:antitoxin MazE